MTRVQLYLFTPLLPGSLNRGNNWQDKTMRILPAGTGRSIPFNRGIDYKDHMSVLLAGTKVEVSM